MTNIHPSSGKAASLDQSPLRTRLKLSRRDAIRSSSAAILAQGVWSGVSAAPSKLANEKLKVLCVGTVNRAASNIAGIESEDIVGLCDIDQTFLDKTAERFPDAKKYRDYREMIAQLSSTADAIVVSTADHHHASAALTGIRAGLHCYCEKPLAHTIEETRALAVAAKRAGVATQMGTQIHATDNYRRVVEIVRSGVLGDINEVHVWVGKGWGGGERPAKADPVPENLDWDLWLGPAPKRPYAAGRYHPAQWRRWWDFGQGTLGDMGCHYMDLPFWALDLRHPTTCEAEGPDPHPETCPTGLIVRYDFPARAKQVPVKLTWYDGDLTPKTVAGESVPNSGVMFVGSEGKMFASYSNYKLYPESSFASFQPPAKTIADSIGHHAEWIRACKEGTPTTCNFDYSGALTESVLLGNVAFRTGKRIDWDGQQLRATNCPEASTYIRKPYRSGWELNLETT